MPLRGTRRWWLTQCDQSSEFRADRRSGRLDDVTELGVEEELTHEAVEQRGEPADGRNGDQSVGSGDASGFSRARMCSACSCTRQRGPSTSTTSKLSSGNGSWRASRTSAVSPPGRPNRSAEAGGRYFPFGWRTAVRGSTREINSEQLHDQSVVPAAVGAALVLAHHARRAGTPYLRTVPAGRSPATPPARTTPPPPKRCSTRSATPNVRPSHRHRTRRDLTPEFAPSR